MVALRLIGGNTTNKPTKQWSNRDGYGARITLELTSGRIIRELRAGEGFSAQHSHTLYIGLGDQRRITVLHVDWPSGHSQHFTDIAAQSLIHIYENPNASPNAKAIVIAPYNATNKSRYKARSNE